MSPDGDWLHWAPLESSRLRRLVLLGAGALSVGALSALASAAAAAPGLVRGSLFAAAVAGLAAVVFALRRPKPKLQIRLGADGSLWTRSAPGAPEVAASPEFMSPWLLVVRQERRHIPIWRDQLPERHFGRLGACVRWRVVRADPVRIDRHVDPSR